jgi:protein-L-isoaspartate(D-aspartate) O-methyltransferase
VKKQIEESFKLKREQLVYHMQGIGALKAQNLKQAFLAVKRELFLPEQLQNAAYADDALPIGFNQTISQPSTIAIMLEMLDVQEGMKVLEVGVGCGYAAALLSELVGEKGKVFGIDIVPELIPLAEENLKKQNSKNVTLIEGDGTKGLPKKKPFDRILISAACPYVPKPLLDQLKEKGVVVAPVGDRFSQQMIKMTKFKGKPVKSTYMGGMFAFVPLRGEFGWR